MTDLQQWNNSCGFREIHLGDMVLGFRETNILTSKEMEVLYYLLKWLTLEQIARVRNLSIKKSAHK